MSVDTMKLLHSRLTEHSFMLIHYFKRGGHTTMYVRLL